MISDQRESVEAEAGLEPFWRQVNLNECKAEAT